MGSRARRLGPALVARRRGERGGIALMTGLLASALLVTCALVVDMGLARDTRRDSQNASDASALAAANALYPDSDTCSNALDVAPPCFNDAVDAAKSYAAVNFDVTDAEWNDCTDPEKFYVLPGSTECVSFTGDSLLSVLPPDPSKVRVLMPFRDVDVRFGAATEIERVRVDSDARASVDAGLTVDCALCFLGPFDSGNADYNVFGGSIAFNDDVTFTGGGTAHITASDGGIFVAGSYEQPENFSPAVEATTSFDDPLAGMGLPAGKAGLTTKTGAPCDTTTKEKGKTVSTPGDGPGIYGDYALDGTCDLAPGLYIITGQWSLKNNDLLTNQAGGVTLYFTCGTPAAPLACSSAGQAGGQLFGKNGDIDLTARTTDPVAGFAVVYDRNNTSTVQLQGNGVGTINGGLYAKSAALEFNGSSDFVFNGGPVVANGIVKGNGTGSGVDIYEASSLTVNELPGDIALDE